MNIIISLTGENSSAWRHSWPSYIGAHSASLRPGPSLCAATQRHSVQFHTKIGRNMLIMRSEERRAYTMGLYPYLRTSLAIFGGGFVIGLIIVSRFPPLTDYFQDTIATF